MDPFNRRAFLSLFPSVAMVGSSNLQRLVTSTALQSSFREIPAQFVHPDIHEIHTLGYLTPGDRSHATYVSDHLATPALAALSPRFCTASADGRYWRAAITHQGLVPVAAGGAAGSLLGATGNLSNSNQLVENRQTGLISPLPMSLTNDQPIIAQALAYQYQIRAKGLLFNDGNYSIWCPLRTAQDDNINLDKTGIPFVLHGPTIFQAGPNGTTFNRRKFDGSDPAIFHGTQYLSYNWVKNGQGIYWRGGMFMLAGLPDPRPTYSVLAALHLKGNWNINGGIPQSANHAGLITNGTSWYELNPDGSGWDVTDRAIWAENDRHTGDIIFDGNITIGGFRGELLLQPGITHGSVYQTGQLIMHDTDGDGFNPEPFYSNGTPTGFGTVQMESLTIRNAYQALEGATGWNGYIHNLTIQDCVQGGGLMSGIWGVGPPRTDRSPAVFTVNNLILTRTNGFYALRGNNISKVSATDSALNIGIFNMNTTDVKIGSVNIIADRGNIDDGIVFFSAGAKGSRSTYNNSISQVTLSQTNSARAAGYCVIDPLDWFGSFGDGNVIGEMDGIAWVAPFARDLALVFDESPKIVKNDIQYLSNP